MNQVSLSQIEIFLVIGLTQSRTRRRHTLDLLSWSIVKAPEEAELLSVVSFSSTLPKFMSMKSGEPLDSFFSSVFRWAGLVLGKNSALLNLSMMVLRGLWLSVGGSWVMYMTLWSTFRICWMGSLIWRTFLGDIERVGAPLPVLTKTKSVSLK